MRVQKRVNTHTHTHTHKKNSKKKVTTELANEKNEKESLNLNIDIKESKSNDNNMLGKPSNNMGGSENVSVSPVIKDALTISFVAGANQMNSAMNNNNNSNNAMLMQQHHTLNLSRPDESPLLDTSDYAQSPKSSNKGGHGHTLDASVRLTDSAMPIGYTYSHLCFFFVFLCDLCL